MTSRIRRKLGCDALSVENALWLQTQSGTAVAAQYLARKGMPLEVITRVLTTLQRRRRRRDRRKTKRE